MYISSSLTIWQCNDNVNSYEDGISGRPDSFTAVGYQILAFIQVLEKQRLWKKVGKCDKTGKSRGWNNSKFTDLFTPASAMASSLDRKREMHQEKVITGDYPMHERETMSAVSLPEFNSFF